MNPQRDTTLLEQVKSETPPPLHNIIEELWNRLPAELFVLLGKRDGAAQLCERLTEIYAPSAVVMRDGQALDPQRAWELSGLFYHNQGRDKEAIIAKGANLVGLLRQKYEKIRFDITEVKPRAIGGAAKRRRVRK